MEGTVVYVEAARAKSCASATHPTRSSTGFHTAFRIKIAATPIEQATRFELACSANAAKQTTGGRTARSVLFFACVVQELIVGDVEAAGAFAHAHRVDPEESAADVVAANAVNEQASAFGVATGTVPDALCSIPLRSAAQFEALHRQHHVTRDICIRQATCLRRKILTNTVCNDIAKRITRCNLVTGHSRYAIADARLGNQRMFNRTTIFRPLARAGLNDWWIGCTSLDAIGNARKRIVEAGAAARTDKRVEITRCDEIDALTLVVNSTINVAGGDQRARAGNLRIAVPIAADAANGIEDRYANEWVRRFTVTFDDGVLPVDASSDLGGSTELIREAQSLARLTTRGRSATCADLARVIKPVAITIAEAAGSNAEESAQQIIATHFIDDRASTAGKPEATCPSSSAYRTLALETAAVFFRATDKVHLCARFRYAIVIAVEAASPDDSAALRVVAQVSSINSFAKHFGGHHARIRIETTCTCWHVFARVVERVAVVVTFANRSDSEETAEYVVAADLVDFSASTAGETKATGAGSPTLT